MWVGKCAILDNDGLPSVHAEGKIQAPMQRSAFSILLLAILLNFSAQCISLAQAPAAPAAPAAAGTAPETAGLLEALKRPQPWTDRTGRVFIGTPKSLDKGTVVFSRTGGQDVTVPLTSLSDVSVIALHSAFNGLAIPALPETAATAAGLATPLASAIAPVAGTAATTAAPMTPPAAGAAAGIPLDVANTNAIKAAMNTPATVEGKVKSVSTLSGGQMRINFHGTNDFVIFVPKRVAEAPEWAFDTLPEVIVRATGKIVEYNGKLEIVADNFAQVLRVP
jgi:hypothetical protein